MSDEKSIYDTVRTQNQKVRRTVAHKAITLPKRDSAHKALPIETDDMEKALRQQDERDKQGKE